MHLKRNRKYRKGGFFVKLRENICMNNTEIAGIYCRKQTWRKLKLAFARSEYKNAAFNKLFLNIHKKIN